MNDLTKLADEMLCYNWEFPPPLQEWAARIKAAAVKDEREYAVIAWASDELWLASVDADERLVYVSNCEITPFLIPLYVKQT